ncbi:MAG: extracellular solute-binding protein [Candidatus Brocadiales bacterium]|nr:extracellular solute-binding protein [Candidatus Brocadiales bacterium]MBL7005506.1 extracellular solute-binding protein [Spirochaetia bacterium]
MNSQIMKRISAIFIVLLLTVPFVFAQGASEAKTEEQRVVWRFANTGGPQAATEPSSDPEVYQMMQDWILEETGILVKTIVPPKDQITEKLNLLLASKSDLDIFDANVKVYQPKGALYPLNDLLDEYGQNILKQWPDQWESSWRAMSTADGTIWGIPSLPALFPYSVFIRSDWLKDLGLDEPTNLNEFEAVLKAFKEQDPAGNGETIPLTTMSLAYLGNSFAAGFMDIAYGNWIDENGQVMPVEVHPQFKDYIAKMADWYAKGYLYEESIGLSRDRHGELVQQNKVGASAVWYTRLTQNMTNLKLNIPEAEFTPLVNMTGPEGKIYTNRDVFTSAVCIAKNSQNPEDAMRFINWSQQDFNTYYSVNNGFEGTHWEYVKDSEPFIIQKLEADKKYIGEFQPHLSFAFTVKASSITEDPSALLATEFLQKYIPQLDLGKKAGDFGVAPLYSSESIQAAVPNEGDINRLREEEVTKFIMGIRPLSEYGDFIDDMYDAGLQKWIDAYTAEYNRVTGK